MADLVVPGLGSVADALVKILRLCNEMKEGQDACTRLHARLKDILDELVRLEERKELPPSDALAKYLAVIKRYHAYLVAYRAKALASRLIRHRKMMGELQEIHQDVTVLFRILDLATAATMMQWKKQWEREQQRQEKAMAEMVSSDAMVLQELQSARAKTEAMMTLMFEMKERADQQSGEALELMKRLSSTVIRASKSTVRELPPWFMPSDEVSFAPDAFARGSFGSVHRGVWGAGTSVVVKCLLIDETQMDERAQQRVETEMNIWHRLNHPNVIKMFGASHVSSPPFIVCEDATNGNMCSFLARSEHNKRHVWRLLYQSALGLDYVHRNRIVHGDLKLNNILVGADGLAKLSDFGLSTVRTSATLSGSLRDGSDVVGGLRWRAPECLRRRPTVASDVYSFAMCIIEAFSGEPPFGFLDDESVRQALREGEIPDQPDTMEDAAWELVVSMTAKDPKVRLPLAQVLDKLKMFADAEMEAESSRPIDGMSEPETEEPTTRKVSTTSCGTCGIAVPSDSTFCASCGARVKASTAPDTSRAGGLVDNTNLVTALMQTIANGRPEDKEQALLLLARRCIDKQERESLYSAENIRVLSQVVQSGATYLSQLYAFESLSWAVEDAAGVSDADMKALRAGVRDPSREELTDFATNLFKSTTLDHIIDRTVVYSCLGKLSMWRSFDYCDGMIFVATTSIMINGDGLQQLWAVYALRNLSHNARGREVIARVGGIPPLAALLRTGTDEQKRWAAFALGNLAMHNDSCSAIAREGAISPLVELSKSGSTEQKASAVWALGHLASQQANSSAIVHAGGIPPLVMLMKTGAGSQRQWAATALANLASDSESIHLAIVRDGGIPPLISLVETGNNEEKAKAAFALGNLTQSEVGCATIVHDGAIPPLVKLLKTGTSQQKNYAAISLGNIASCGGENCTAIASEGGIPLFVSLLKTGSLEEKGYAVFTLANLAFNNQANCLAIVIEGAIPLLVALLRTGDDVLKEEAALGLVNLAITDTNRAMIGLEGAIPPLVTLLTTGTDVQKSHAAHALAYLMTNNDTNRDAVVRDGGILPLVALVRTGNDDQRMKAARALGNLCSGSHSNRETVGRKGGIPPLVALVMSGDEEQKRHAAFALSNLTFRNHSNCATVVSENGIPSLVMLLRSGDDEQKKFAAFALANLAIDRPSNSSAIVREGGIPTLVMQLRTGSDEQKSRAAYVLSNLAYCFSDNAVAIVNEGGLPPLVALLTTGNDEQKCQAASTLGTLAYSGQGVKEAMHETGVVSSLEALRSSSSADVQRAVEEALTKTRKRKGFLARFKS